MKKNLTLCFLYCAVTLFYTQSSYSLGVHIGGGVNIYSNKYDTDENHFKFNSPISGNIGVKLLKYMDEKNAFLLELNHSRKTIEFDYDLNEKEIPYKLKDNIGQKYSTISMHVGYRRTLPSFKLQKFFEVSVGADYNSNVIVSTRGNGEGTDVEFSEPILYTNFYNTNLDEKSYTLSANLGFGVNFGSRNQYEFGAIFNIPFQKIQKKTSQYQYEWEYQDQIFSHRLDYLGKIYYPNLKLTYYIF